VDAGAASPGIAPGLVRDGARSLVAGGEVTGDEPSFVHFFTPGCASSRPPFPFTDASTDRLRARRTRYWNKSSSREKLDATQPSLDRGPTALRFLAADCEGFTHRCSAASDELDAVIEELKRKEKVHGRKK